MAHIIKFLRLQSANLIIKHQNVKLISLDGLKRSLSCRPLPHVKCLFYGVQSESPEDPAQEVRVKGKGPSCCIGLLISFCPS